MDLEYRLCVRKPVDLSITVQDELGATAIVDCLDLCAVGAALDTSDFPLINGSIVHLEFDLAHTQPCSVRGEVVRQGPRTAGVQFNEFDASTFQQIVDWLYSKRTPGRAMPQPLVPQEV